MKKLGLVVAVSAAMGLATTTVKAAETSPSFDYVAGSYVNLDAMGTHIGGAQVDYSKTFNENFFAYGSANHLTKSSLNADTTNVAAGIGYKVDIAPSTSLYGVAALAYSRISVMGLRDNDTGYLLNAGIRHALTSNFEVDAYVQHLDVFSGSDQTYTVGGKYYLSPEWAVQAGYSYLDSDNDALTFGVSYNF